MELDAELMHELQESLMLFFTGSTHHSWTILEEQEKSTRSHGPATQALNEGKLLAEQMRQALQKADLRTFGLLLNEAWQAKKRVSSKISNSRIDQLYDLALQNGALAGKITGAGGGGFLLLFCEPPQQDQVRETLSAQGIREMAFAFDFQGAQLIVNDPFIDGDERAASRWTFVPSSSAS